MLESTEKEWRFRMISTFDITKLNALLKDFYNLTQIRITIFDENFHELAAYPEHIAPFCQIIRTDEAGRNECQHCDENACKIAAKRHSLYTYQCHAGLTESIRPLYMGNIIIGYLFFGHVFAYESHEIGWKEIKKRCQIYKINMSDLQKACFMQPLKTESYITSASHILEAVAAYLCLERMTSLRSQKLPVRIDEYIQSHFTEDIDAMQIAHEFGIGKTQLYEIASQNYVTGIAEHIRNLRIQKAKKMLMESELPLAEISAQCGFKDYNYFITVFKKTVGIPPKKYKNLTANE